MCLRETRGDMNSVLPLRETAAEEGEGVEEEEGEMRGCCRRKTKRLLEEHREVLCFIVVFFFTRHCVPERSC